MPYLCVLIYFVFFAGVAMTVNEGLWNNALNLIGVMIAGVAGVCLGFPLGLVLQEKLDKPAEFTWYFVFAGVWLSFVATIVIYRLIADRLASRTRMKFVPPLELAAGPIVGLLVAVMFSSFLAFTLYYIPIRAGNWSAAGAPGWQMTTMRGGAGPFYTVLKAVAGDDVARGAVGQ